jgi:hypothetical protein
MEHFKGMKNNKLIRVVNCRLDYAMRKNAEIYTVPEEHQQLVMERFYQVRNNPEILLDWEMAKKSLKVK